MPTLTHSLAPLHAKIEAIETQLLGAVEDADDHALFVASYLHGHFDLVIVNTLKQSNPTVAALDAQMQASLANAFDKGELDVADQTLVSELWQRLLQE